MYLLVNLQEIYTGLGSKACTEPRIQVIHDGAIAIQDDRIIELGPRPELEQRYPEAERIDLGGKVAIPSFVDPHTHLVWGGDRADEFNLRLHGATYAEIATKGGGIKKTVSQTRAASSNQLYCKAKKTLDTMLLHGIATIEAKSGYGLSLECEEKILDTMDRLSAEHPMELVQTFMGAHDIPPEFAGRPRDYIQHLNEAVLPRIAARGTVRYVDIFCEKGVFELEETRSHMEAAKKLGFGLRIHADELFPLGGAGLAADLGAVSADHLMFASEPDMAKMAAAGTFATLLPGTSFFLRMGRYADAAAFRRAGCKIALSTDFNPGSSHTVSQALMMALACMNLGLTFEEAFLGVSLHAADTLGLADQIGTLEPGKRADITFLDAPSAFYLVYYWGINLVTDVLKSGKWVVRDRKLTYETAFPKPC